MTHGAASWTPILQAFGTIVVGLAASSLAYWQWSTATEKLKLDLYDRRSAYLQEATSNYIQVFRDGPQAIDELKMLRFNLLRMSTLFEESTVKIANGLLRDVDFLIRTKDNPKNSERISDVFQTLTENFPLLTEAALSDMKIAIPRGPRKMASAAWARVSRSWRWIR